MEWARAKRRYHWLDRTGKTSERGRRAGVREAALLFFDDRTLGKVGKIRNERGGVRQVNRYIIFLSWGFLRILLCFFNRVSVEFVFCTIFVIVKIYVCGLGVLQDLECCASQEPGATALFRMVPHVFVNSIQEVPGQGDVEFLGFSEVFGHIDIDDCPDTARELRVARVMGNGSRYRNVRAVLGEQFQMAFDGFISGFRMSMSDESQALLSSRSGIFGELVNQAGGNLERVKGIEPSLSAWEAGVMPLYDTRAGPLCTRTLRRFEALSR